MGVERMNDHISEMNEKEIDQACLEILGMVTLAASNNVSDLSIVGAIVFKLEEWGYAFTFRPDEGWIIGCSCTFHRSLRVAFLRHCLIEGRWEAPKVKEEPEFAHFLTHEGSVLSITLGLGNDTDISYFTKGRGFKRVRVSPWEEKA